MIHNAYGLQYYLQQRDLQRIADTQQRLQKQGWLLLPPPTAIEIAMHHRLPKQRVPQFLLHLQQALPNSAMPATNHAAGGFAALIAFL